MSRRELPLLTVREFRAQFSKLTHPVRVIRSRGKVEILGLWTPTKRNSEVADSTSVRYPPEKSNSSEPERSGKREDA